MVVTACNKAEAEIFKRLLPVLAEMLTECGVVAENNFVSAREVLCFKRIYPAELLFSVGSFFISIESY